MHIFAFGISFATAIFALMHQLYNNSNYYCWIGFNNADDSSSIDDEFDSNSDEKLVWVFRYVCFFSGLLRLNTAVFVVTIFSLPIAFLLLCFPSNRRQTQIENIDGHFGMVYVGSVL